MLDPSTDPFDPSSIDLDGFTRELAALRAEAEEALGEEDLRHLRRIERLGRLCTAVGWATAAVPNPLSMAALSVGRSTGWLLMHHIGHRGYDRVPNVPPRYTSKVFARGRRRFIDWLDWITPESWVYEHNVLHHACTGEDEDPDLIERNSETLRASGAPVAAKYAAMALLALTWREFYYAPKTLRAWMDRTLPRAQRLAAAAGEGEAHTWKLWKESYLPYAGVQFGLLPLCFWPLGPLAVASAFANSFVADLLTNLHTFCVVGPNHAGDDLYRFDDKPKDRRERLLRQVLGSVNYRCGTEAVDFAHLWLNYQIEHHLWPDLTMLQYRRLQPRVRELCQRYGVPYVQQSVFTRIRKMLDIAVGKRSMRRLSRNEATAQLEEVPRGAATAG